jgi:hypothetical protein
MLRCIKLRSGLEHAQRRLRRIGIGCALRALIEATKQPALEAFASDRPIFPVPVHIETGVANVIAVVK